MTPGSPASSPGNGPGSHGAGRAVVRILFIVGPHASTGGLGAVARDGLTHLAALDAEVERVVTSGEREAVEAVTGPCDAVVIDPGSLEHYSRWLADAVRRLRVPVIVVRGGGDDTVGVMGDQRLVTSAATASIAGGGPAAYDSAIEAAAWLARQAAGPG